MYPSIQTLPLCKLIDYLADDNIYGLVISGVAEPEVLREQWAHIMQQIATISNNQEYRLYLNLYKEVAELELTYAQIKLLAGDEKLDPETGAVVQLPGMLRMVYDKMLCDDLCKLISTKMVFNPADRASYLAALDKAIRRTASMKIKIDLKRLTLDAMEKKHNKKAEEQQGPKDIRQYFEGVLITLEDHAKIPLSADTITVFRYYERIQRLNQYYDALKNSRKK